MSDVLLPKYLCDPEKNKQCAKELCFINGGPCEYTTYKEYAAEDCKHED